jgi:dihydrofolate reductase
MGKVIYSAAMSLDGFIAGPGGDMSWMRPYAGPNPEFDQLQREIGALLIGTRTFHGDDPNKGTDNEGAFGGTWHGPSFVLTHDVDQAPVDGCTFVGDLASGVAAAKAAAGDRYVAILGADVARQCLEADELDDVALAVLPVLLGDGTRLFASAGGHQVALVQERVTAMATGFNVWMRVDRQPA